MRPLAEPQYEAESYSLFAGETAFLKGCMERFFLLDTINQWDWMRFFLRGSWSEPSVGDFIVVVGFS